MSRVFSESEKEFLRKLATQRSEHLQTVYHFFAEVIYANQTDCFFGNFRSNSGKQVPYMYVKYGLTEETKNKLYRDFLDKLILLEWLQRERFTFYCSLPDDHSTVCTLRNIQTTENPFVIISEDYGKLQFSGDYNFICNEQNNRIFQLMSFHGSNIGDLINSVLPCGLYVSSSLTEFVDNDFRTKEEQLAEDSLTEARKSNKTAWWAIGITVIVGICQIVLVFLQYLRTFHN